MYYYAEELWCEYRTAWAQGKRKVLNLEWHADQFSDEIENLKAQQKLIWDILLADVDSICTCLAGPHDDVVTAHVLKLFEKGKRVPERKELYRDYHYKLHQEFEDAENDYQLLCAYPEGTLTRVKLFWVNSRIHL